MTITAWAVLSKGRMTWSDLKPRIFGTKAEAKRAVYLYGDMVVRVRIEEIPSKCRSGCALVDDVPVFCKKHSPLDRAEKP